MKRNIIFASYLINFITLLIYISENLNFIRVFLFKFKFYDQKYYHQYFDFEHLFENYKMVI